MFGPLGLPELLMIFAVVLIVFGPRRIPEFGRMLGKALAEFRKATDDLKGTLEREVRLEELKQMVPTTMASFDSVSRSEPPAELAAVEAEPAPAAAPESASASAPPPADESAS